MSYFSIGGNIWINQPKIMSNLKQDTRMDVKKQKNRGENSPLFKFHNDRY